MTIWKFPETQKQLKPNTLDSRLRGNDGEGGCRLKRRAEAYPTIVSESHPTIVSASIPLGGNVSGMGRFIRKSPF
ncbi:hypothetical protein [Neisseria lactamica]|uniref:hypothetical protein n=1 Tax=Neisseria lactamica TaxID=486 RepID=UPI0015F0C0C6|nr:hypothetical protein [Neisseria lactamica]